MLAASMPLKLENENRTSAHPKRQSQFRGSMRCSFCNTPGRPRPGREKSGQFLHSSFGNAHSGAESAIPCLGGMLMEFQSINFGRETPTGGSRAATGRPIAATFFRESYIDFRPFQSWAPYLNFIRMGIFRMPFGIFTETSGGLRDMISLPYLTSVGSGIGNSTGAAGTVDFLQERDFFVDLRGKLSNRLEYVAGIMNNNNFHANATGANAPKSFYTRVRLFGTDVSWISFTTIQGESNNANTNINGRGKGTFDRYGLDFRYTSKFVPGFMLQGEWWQGHDGANATTVGRPANGTCQNTVLCGGSGAPGVQRRTWYVLGKYLISDGWFQNWEPTVMYEQFDPSTSTSNDLYTRTILGLTYYFENFPPKIQSKIQFNYEFRHHQGNGPGVPYDATFDAFAQNAFLSNSKSDSCNAPIPVHDMRSAGCNACAGRSKEEK